MLEFLSNSSISVDMSWMTVVSSLNFCLSSVRKKDLSYTCLDGPRGLPGFKPTIPC